MDTPGIEPGSAVSPLALPFELRTPIGGPRFREPCPFAEKGDTPSDLQALLAGRHANADAHRSGPESPRISETRTVTVPPEGIEPSTRPLRAACSTTELRRLTFARSLTDRANSFWWDGRRLPATNAAFPLRNVARAPSWTRTSNLRLRKPALYPLSYKDLVGGHGSHGALEFPSPATSAPSCSYSKPYRPRKPRLPRLLSQRDLETSGLTILRSARPNVAGEATHVPWVIQGSNLVCPKAAELQSAGRPIVHITRGVRRDLNPRVLPSQGST